MRGAEGVVLALGALGESGEPAALPQRPDAVTPTRQDLMRIGLVADVPYDAIIRGVEEVVQRHCQLDHPEPGAEMPAGGRDRIYGLLTQLVGQLAQLPGFEAAHVGRCFDKIEQRGLGRLRHGTLQPTKSRGTGCHNLAGRGGGGKPTRGSHVSGGKGARGC